MPRSYDPSIMKVPEPDYNNPWEVYTFFGWAAAHAQSLEKGLVILWTVVRSKAGVDVTSEEFQSIFANADSNSMGPLLDKLRKYKPYTDQFECQLYEAKKMRNYLMHGFYFKTADLLSPANTPQAVEQLRAISNKFQTLIPEVRTITASIVDNYEAIESEVNSKLRAYYRNLNL